VNVTLLEKVLLFTLSATVAVVSFGALVQRQTAWEESVIDERKRRAVVRRLRGGRRA